VSRGGPLDPVRFEQPAKGTPYFAYITAVESAPADWPGERGRVDAGMVKKCVPTLQRSVYCLSSPEGMVKAMRALLVGFSVNEGDIRTEELRVTDRTCVTASSSMLPKLRAAAFAMWDELRPHRTRII
jgi:hypothetical protein